MELKHTWTVQVTSLAYPQNVGCYFWKKCFCERVNKGEPLNNSLATNLFLKGDSAFCQLYNIDDRSGGHILMIRSIWMNRSCIHSFNQKPYNCL